MKCAIACLLLVATATALPTQDIRRTALHNPDLFEGDILGFEPGDRNVDSNILKRWPNKEIPYVIAKSLEIEKNRILSAMDEYHKNTCLKFKPRTDEKNYIMIFYGRGCYSYPGMMDMGEQPVSLGSGCLNMGIIIHELGHAIGFFHEHNRSDRDEYLTIYWDNIQQGEESQFGLLRPDQNLLFTPFDYESIMIYGNYAFSKDYSSPTMEAKNGMPLREPNQKVGLTASDITRVNKMYNC